MKDITGESGRIVRAVFLAVTLSALAACGVLDDGTPGLKIKGSIEAQYGRAKNCELRLTALSDGQWMRTFAVGNRISINWASRYFYDADRGAYRGVNVEISCDNNLSASITITDAAMVARNSNIDLGRITVQ